MNKAKLLTFSLIFISSFFVTKVKADDLTGITISPISQDIKLTADQSYDGKFTLSNNENGDFTLNFEEGEIIDDQITSANLNWFQVINPPKVLKSQSEVEINFSANIPVGTPSGFYSKLLIVKLSMDGGNIDLDIPFKVNITIPPQYNTVSGIVIKELKSEEFIVDSTAKFTITVGNSFEGNLTKPIGYFNIINSVGEIVYSTVLNESLASMTKDKTYNIETNLPLRGLSDIGEYKAQILFTDSISNESAISKTTFLYVNKTYILAGIIITIVILSLGFKAFKPRTN